MASAAVMMIRLTSCFSVALLSVALPPTNEDSGSSVRSVSDAELDLMDDITALEVEAGSVLGLQRSMQLTRNKDSALIEDRDVPAMPEWTDGAVLGLQRSITVTRRQIVPSVDQKTGGLRELGYEAVPLPRPQIFPMPMPEDAHAGDPPLELGVSEGSMLGLQRSVQLLHGRAALIDAEFDKMLVMKGYQAVPVLRPQPLQQPVVDDAGRATDVEERIPLTPGAVLGLPRSTQFLRGHAIDGETHKVNNTALVQGRSSQPNSTKEDVRDRGDLSEASSFHAASVLGLQRSIKIVKRPFAPMEEDDQGYLPGVSSLERASVLGLQRSVQLKRRKVQYTKEPQGSDSDVTVVKV